MIRTNCLRTFYLNVLVTFTQYIHVIYWYIYVPWVIIIIARYKVSFFSRFLVLLSRYRNDNVFRVFNPHEYNASLMQENLELNEQQIQCLFLGMPNAKSNREILTRVTIVRHVWLVWIVNADQFQWWQTDVLDIVLLYVNGWLMFPNARMILVAPMLWTYENKISFRNTYRWTLDNELLYQTHLDCHRNRSLDRSKNLKKKCLLYLQLAYYVNFMKFHEKKTDSDE